ncbi:hypothetical protein PSAC2689_170141 [Paraburkholderia sacchari]|uniref:hypothetical protein n=1 Tax=Paraburkholderia sacchari TaxID=159450 RepID=UPI0039A5C570
MAIGIYTAFLDVAMAGGSPALGWVGGHAGLRAAFLVSAVVGANTTGVVSNCAAGIASLGDSTAWATGSRVTERHDWIACADRARADGQ